VTRVASRLRFYRRLQTTLIVAGVVAAGTGIAGVAGWGVYRLSHPTEPPKTHPRRTQPVINADGTVNDAGTIRIPAPKGASK
jgi:hypothetical protein